MRKRFWPVLVSAAIGFVFGVQFRSGHGPASSVDRSAESHKEAAQQRLVCVVTPTYSRPQQKAELTRLSYTLRLAGNIHWIVVEDSPTMTPLVTSLLKNSGLRYTQLHAETPPAYKLGTKDPNWLKPRGVFQRNAALRYLRESAPDADDSVLYFGDDDNTYDVELFAEMRLTQRASVWPVGLVGGLMVERPIVVDGQVKQFNAVFRPGRAFPIDMAGFAVTLRLVKENSAALFSMNVQRGYQESHFLSQLLSSASDLEPRAANCTRVLVWHTRTEAVRLSAERKLPLPSNYGIEV